MITMQRELTTDSAPDAVFAYLADFTTTEQWDPGTVRTVRIAGDGGVGTRYANTSRFAGRNASTADWRGSSAATRRSQPSWAQHFASS